MNTQSNSLAQSIKERLTDSLKPVFIDVIDESHMHNVARGAQSHFKVILVANTFEGTPRIERHRCVDRALGDLRPLIHALSLKLYTTTEWERRDRQTSDSPLCRGGER
jgi:BolA protein